MTGFRDLRLLCLVLAGTIGFASAEEDADAKPEEAGYVLRPAWEPEKRYRWLQRLKVVATVAGLGKQTMEWRQHFHTVASGDPGSEELTIEIDCVRVDLEVGGEPSRYYFDAQLPLRYQERAGVQGALLRHTELFVRNRYVLRPAASGKGANYRVDVEALAGEGEAAEARDAIWGRLPWEMLSAAMLHQGIPGEPLREGATWHHSEELAISGHGRGMWELECRFAGFKEYEGRNLALIEFKGMVHGVFRKDAGVKDSPGLGIELPAVRGLTLIDLENRSIASTVVKLEGRLRSLGLPGAAENETAPVKKTLTLTLLGIDE